MAKQTLVIFGATGKQGGSVVKSLLNDSKTTDAFHIKAVTRDATKDSAKALAALGAEVVTADLDDPSTLPPVLEGAYGVFAVTNFLEKLSADPELVQGKAIADAAKAAGVQHLNVHHFDVKAKVEAYIRELGIPATFFLAGYFMSNLPGMSIREMPDGNWGLGLPTPPDAPIPLFDAEDDTGKFVKGIFLNRDKLLGARVLGATAYYTPAEIIDQFKELYPKVATKTSYNHLPDQVYTGILGSLGLPETFQLEMLENHKLFAEAGYFGGANLDASHAIVDEPLTTWKEYIANNPAFASIKS